MSGSFGSAFVLIDVNNLIFGVVKSLSESESSHSAKSIDAYFYGAHGGEVAWKGGGGKRK